MDGSIRLSTQELNVLLREVRRGTDPERRLRAHLLVLLADGWEWQLIVSVLFTSTITINRWRHRYLAGGLTAVLESARPRRTRYQWWAALMIQWVACLARGPGNCGSHRSRY